MRYLQYLNFDIRHIKYFGQAENITLNINDTQIATLGNVSNKYISKFSIDTNFLYLEVMLDKVIKNPSQQISTSTYPWITRDMNILIKEDEYIQNLINILYDVSIYIKEIYVVDVWEKKLTLRYVLQSNTDTLTKLEVEDILHKIKDKILNSGYSIL